MGYLIVACSQFILLDVSLGALAAPRPANTAWWYRRGHDSSSEKGASNYALRTRRFPPSNRCCRTNRVAQAVQLKYGLDIGQRDTTWPMVAVDRQRMAAVATIRASVKSTESRPAPRLTLVETPKSEQNLTSLAPKRGLISAQPVQGGGRQAAQADEGTREIVGLLRR